MNFKQESPFDYRDLVNMKCIIVGLGKGSLSIWRSAITLTNAKSLSIGPQE